MPFMKPNENYITIDDNINKIKYFINDMIILPRKNAYKWFELTNQPPNLKIGYPSQHLASLNTGMKRTATGAGNDIVEETEVKSCSKVDQSDKCLDCKTTVLRSDKCCLKCVSPNIKRNKDSKWIIVIKNEYELRMNLDEIPTPKNIFPDGFHFYKCNPIKTFEYTIYNSISTNHELKISKYLIPLKVFNIINYKDIMVKIYSIKLEKFNILNVECER